MPTLEGIRVNVTDDEILEAAHLIADGGYVSTFKLADSLRFNRTALNRRINKLRDRCKWPYSTRYTHQELVELGKQHMENSSHVVTEEEYAEARQFHFAQMVAGNLASPADLERAMGRVPHLLEGIEVDHLYTCDVLTPNRYVVPTPPADLPRREARKAVKCWRKARKATRHITLDRMLSLNPYHRGDRSQPLDFDPEKRARFSNPVELW